MIEGISAPVFDANESNIPVFNAPKKNENPRKRLRTAQEENPGEISVREDPKPKLPESIITLKEALNKTIDELSNKTFDTIKITYEAISTDKIDEEIFFLKSITEIVRKARDRKLIQRRQYRETIA